MSDELKKGGEMIVYQSDDGRVRLDVRLENESLWMTQAAMAELFQTTQQNISLHLQNIYEEGELEPEATYKDFLLVRIEGNREVQRPIAHYNLDAIISVGYRVKSLIATRFRIWATQRLREYIVKGFGRQRRRILKPGVQPHRRNPGLAEIVFPLPEWEQQFRGRIVRRLQRRDVIFQQPRVPFAMLITP